MAFRHGAQLLALTGLAISSPLLNILSDGPEFFVNRRVFPLDIVSLVALLVLVPPLLLLLVEGVARIFGRTSAMVAHGLFVALLSATAVTPMLSAHVFSSGFVTLLVSILLGLVVAVCVTRYVTAGTWLSWMALLTIFSVVNFLRSEGISTLLSPTNVAQENGFTKHSETPVVVLIFDEFPLNGILDKNREIDALRFPNFAALAKDAIWYKNAAAVNQFTPIALPAILSGKMPRSLKQLPTAESYPVNLFTLLARSHAVRAYEPFTKLCPDDLCGRKKRRTSWRGRMKAMIKDLAAVYLNYVVPSDVEVGVPNIDGKWGDFWDETNANWDAPNFSREGRVESFRRFVQGLKPPTDKPPFIFVHVIMPHMPHQFLPSGKMYAPGVLQAYVKDRWSEDPELRRISYQQFVMQLGATDKILGEFVAKLREIGIYDKALFVAVADHGMSFQPHTHRRGDLANPAFYDDVMSIPLFVKLPGAGNGAVSERHAQTIDVVPTVLDALGLDYNVSFDGVSLLRQDVPDRTEQNLLVGRISKEEAKKAGDTSQPVKEGTMRSFPVSSQVSRPTIDWKYSLPGYDSPKSYNPYFIGPRGELLGRHIKEFSVTPGDGQFQFILRSGKPDPSRARGELRYDPKTGVCPCNLQGTLEGKTLAVRDEIAIAVNGVIQSVTTLLPGSPGSYLFASLMLDSAFQPGTNNVVLYKVTAGANGNITLQELRAL
jgi:hypothetical protein